MNQTVIFWGPVLLDLTKHERKNKPKSVFVVQRHQILISTSQCQFLLQLSDRRPPTQNKPIIVSCDMTFCFYLVITVVLATWPKDVLFPGAGNTWESTTG